MHPLYRCYESPKLFEPDYMYNFYHFKARLEWPLEELHFFFFFFFCASMFCFFIIFIIFPEFAELK